ncbi:M23 family metallopeptidase [Wenzhouxiangella sp. XN201]|uniref:M23 family metallopeptidase n=1 Tax=Wenzhouxiangella sp. XN201 TaxID=2710755 RepID=UPI0013C86E22|nr:M23 family metallopeptidase [Wenzhouxiangella sp. XN201]NEZ03833.1 M23 family metallopeptidase [Wenzhouxiangella sp. XN201]
MRDRPGLTVLLLILLPLSAASAVAADNGNITFSSEPLQGSLLIGQAPPGSRVSLDGEPVMTGDDGRFLVAMAREQTRARKVTARLPDGSEIERVLEPIERDFDIQRIDGLPEDKVTPPEAVLERIRAEARLARQARERRDSRTDWLDGFDWPLTGPVTGVYGSQRILNGEPRNPHWGIDVAAATGTPVKAPAPGLVTLVHDDMYFSGGTLFIDHGHGLVSAFLHLERIHVETGQQVARGDVIAEVGATGRATGPHLDWRMNLGDIRIDPGLLLDWSENPDAR